MTPTYLKPKKKKQPPTIGYILNKTVYPLTYEKESTNTNHKIAVGEVVTLNRRVGPYGEFTIFKYGAPSAQKKVMLALTASGDGYKIINKKRQDVTTVINPGVRLFIRVNKMGILDIFTTKNGYFNGDDVQQATADFDHSNPPGNIVVLASGFGKTE